MYVCMGVRFVPVVNYMIGFKVGLKAKMTEQPENQNASLTSPFPALIGVAFVS